LLQEVLSKFGRKFPDALVPDRINIIDLGKVTAGSILVNMRTCRGQIYAASK
jgi:hypothetical protein